MHKECCPITRGVRFGLPLHLVWQVIIGEGDVASHEVPVHAHARRQPQEAIAKRTYAKMALVIISERYNKKAAKKLTSAVRFPFSSKDTYERSIRQPLGRDFNMAPVHPGKLNPKSQNLSC